MAHYTVIKPDSTIYKDGKVASKCDMSGLPEDFWSLQWDGTNGHVEWDGSPNTSVTSKSEIESALGVSLPTLIERRDAKIAENKAEEDARVKAELENE